MQSFDINIPINTTRNIDAQGDYLSYYVGSAGGADATLLLSHDSSGSTIQLKPGQAIRLQKGQSGGLWRLANYANQAAIVGVVVIGSGQIDDHTVSGTVAVVDNSFSQVIINTVFQCNANKTGVNGACYELRNTGADYIEILEVATATSGAASEVSMGMYSGVALANVMAGPESNLLDSAGVVSDAGAQWRWADINTVATITAKIASQVAGIPMDRNRPVKPILVKPGTSFMVILPAAYNFLCNITYHRRAS